MKNTIRYTTLNEISVSIGRSANANAQDSVAIGNNANVDSAAEGSIVLGANTQSTAVASNSATLGQYSVANEANTISVGNDNLKRRITNVADGINDTDSVNMRQFNELGGRVNRLDKKVRGLGAMSSAMSALVPNARSNKDTQLSLGMGQYSGETALAVGIFHYEENHGNDVLFNAGISYTYEAGTAVRAGITWGF